MSEETLKMGRNLLKKLEAFDAAVAQQFMQMRKELPGSGSHEVTDGLQRAMRIATDKARQFIIEEMEG